MIKRIQNASLQTKIIILFMLMGTLLTATFGTMLYRNTIESAYSNKEREMISLASTTANKIERFLFERSADITVLAKSQIFTMPEISHQTRVNYLNNVINEYKAYDSIFVLDVNGFIEEYAGPIKSDKYYIDYKKNFLSDKQFITDIITTNDGKFIMYFSEPLYDSEGNHIGAIVERINFNAIEEIIENVKIGDTGVAYIQKINPVSVDKYDSLQDTIVNGNEYLNARYPLIKYPTQKEQWVININQHKDEALSIKQEIERYLGYIIVTLLIFFYGISTFISKKLTKPIRNLMKKTSMMIEGNHKFASDVIVSDEVKNLTSSFDLLLEELHFMMQQVLEKSGEAAHIEVIRNSIEELFDHIPNGIITIDAKGQITSVNNVALEILNSNKSELLSKFIEREIPLNLQPFFNLIAKQFETNSKYHEEVFRLHNDNGETIPIIFSTLRQTDLHQNLIGVTLIINNLDAKRKFDESILRAKKLAELGELSAGVAHEIRNPLASIKGYAQVALQDLNPKSQIAEDLSVILSEVDRLEKIIDRFMTFARPNKPNFQLCHMNEIIKETIQLISKGKQSRNINIRHRYTKKDLVYADCEQMKQVILNLILNSAQAMPNGGQIEIVTVLNEKSNTMEIHIADTGEGIKEDIQKRIFTPFFTTRDEGTGLGLAICSRIVENHKGIIEMVSKVNEGTKVIIKLPLEKGIYS